MDAGDTEAGFHGLDPVEIVAVVLVFLGLVWWVASGGYGRFMRASRRSMYGGEAYPPRYRRR